MYNLSGNNFIGAEYFARQVAEYMWTMVDLGYDQSPFLRMVQRHAPRLAWGYAVSASVLADMVMATFAARCRAD